MQLIIFDFHYVKVSVVISNSQDTLLKYSYIFFKKKMYTYQQAKMR